MEWLSRVLIRIRLTQKKLFIAITVNAIIVLLFYFLIYFLTHQILHTFTFFYIFAFLTLSSLLLSMKHQLENKDYLKSDIFGAVAYFSISCMGILQIIEQFSHQLYLYRITDILILLFVITILCMIVFRPK